MVYNMISYALITNGQYNPFLAVPLPDHMKYPISQNCSEGIDLDYTALMLGEQFFVIKELAHIYALGPISISPATNDSKPIKQSS